MHAKDNLTLHSLFTAGMKRTLLAPRQALEGLPTLELGPGNRPVFKADLVLELPGWNGDTMPIPLASDSVGGIYAFHFFEHFTGKRVIELLRECERVLHPGGVLNIVVPHRLGAMAFQDLDHKAFFTEDSWRELFSNPFYDKGREVPWRLTINTNVIIGIVERNLALMTQLVKE